MLIFVAFSPNLLITIFLGIRRVSVGTQKFKTPPFSQIRGINWYDIFFFFFKSASLRQYHACESSGHDCWNITLPSLCLEICIKIYG